MAEEVRMNYPVRVTLILDDTVIRTVSDGFGGRFAVRAITGIKWENVDRDQRDYEVVAEIPDELASSREVKTPPIRADELAEFILPVEERFTNENFILRLRPKPQRIGTQQG